MAEHQPDFETLSAWLDGELDAAANRRVDAHLAACPACLAQVAALRELSAGFAALRHDALGTDLADVIHGRVMAATPARRPPPRPRQNWFAWLPVAFGAAASLALGVGLGTSLPGAAAEPTLLAAMRVFDPLPPGSVCLGSDACYPKGMPR